MSFDSSAFDVSAFDEAAFLFDEEIVLVEVPDVVGETQAAGTATLQGAGFVVSVATASSGVVAAGDIISQSPAAETEAPSGSTVIITVSSGESSGIRVLRRPARRVRASA